MTLRKSRVIDFDAVLRRERARSAALRKSEAHRRKKETSRRLSASLTPDRWFCERCNKWHPKIEECPTIKPVVDRIENRLGRAFGQSDKYSGSILAALALDINIWARHSHSIAKIRKRYLRHPELGPYLRREHIIPYEIIPIERSPPTLTAEQAGLAYNHWLVVRKLAGQFAPDNKALRDNLEAHGLEELVNLIRRYDPARGVAFGAFAKPHLAKAMREYVRDYHRTTVPISPELIDWAMGDRTRKRTANVKYEEREGRTNFDRQRDEIAKLSRDRDRSCWQREQADKATKEFVEAERVINRVHVLGRHVVDQASGEQLVANASAGDWLGRLGDLVHRINEGERLLISAPDLFRASLKLGVRGQIRASLKLLGHAAPFATARRLPTRKLYLRGVM